MPGPLLNRRQLWLLIILMPGIILLLTLFGPMPGQPQVYASNDQRVYQYLHDEAFYQLQLQLTRPRPDTPSTWLMGQLLPQVLALRIRHPDTRVWLQQQNWQLQLQPDTAEPVLNIHTSLPPTNAQIQTLLAYLRNPVDIDWDQLIQRHSAQHYLNLQSTQERALAALQSDSLPASWRLEPEQFFTAMTRAEHWQLTLMTPELQPLHSPTDATSATPPTDNHQAPVTLLPRPLPQDHMQAYYWRWPATTELTEVMKEQLALQCLRHALSGQVTRGSYQLRWQAWANGSDLSLLLMPPTDTALNTWLQCPEGPDFDRLKQTLSDEWTDRFQTDPAAWLRLLARHRLPATEPDRLNAAIGPLQSSDIEHYLQQGPRSDSYRRLIFPRPAEDSNAAPQ